MRKSLFLLFLIFIATSGSKAQTWTRMQSWGLDLETLSWINDSVGYAAGEDLLIRSQDRGVTWKEVDFLPNERVLGLAFLSETIGIGVGENGMIIRTSDGGNTWSEINSPTGNNLKTIAFFDETLVLVLGEGNLILTSNDLGLTWIERNSFPSIGINDLTFASSDSIFIVGESGQIQLSVDQGETWIPKSTSTSESLNKLAFSSQGVGFAVGQNGTIIRSMDGGENWLSLNSTVSVNLNDVDVSPTNTNNIIVVGEEATALRSTNGGNSFGKANLGAGNIRNLSQVKFLPAQNTAFAIGKDGYLISSTNGGGSWTTRLAGIRNDFTDTDFKTDRFGFFAGANGAFYLTGNGGLSIISRPLPEDLDIISLDFWNTGFGYVSGADGRMFRTGNGGNSWVNVSAPTSENINGFYLFAPSVLYIAGNSGYIARSFESGGNWNAEVEANTTENLKDVTFFDFQVGFAMGDNGQISWSNGGNVWENIPKLTDENLNALAKVDSSTAIIVGQNGVILKSEDKARTWRRINVPFTENIKDVDFWDDKLGLAAGDNGFTIQTKDGGETWTRIPTGTRSNLSAVSIGNPLVAFAVGEDGTLLNYTCFPPGPLSEISGSMTSCLGRQTYRIDEPQVEGAFIEWRVDGGKILRGQGTSSIEVEWEIPGRNAVLVTNENFCGNGDTSALEVTVSDIPPSILQIQGTGAVCTELENKYSVTSLPGVDFQWQVTGGNIISGQGNSEIIVAWEEKGLQEVRLIMENTCGKSNQIILPVQVSSPPEQPSEIVGEALLGLGEAVYEIEAVSGVNYTWEIPSSAGRITSGQGSPRVTIQWENEGEFTITVTPRNECDEGAAQTLSVEVNIITSLEPELNQDLKIYPNPSQGKLWIEASDLSQWSNVEVISSNGMLIRSMEINLGTRRIEFNQLPRGLFLVRLTGQKDVIVRKVLVQ